MKLKGVESGVVGIMGVTGSRITGSGALTKQCFLIDRLIAAQCDFLEGAAEQTIRMGVYSGGDEKNPLGKQGLRIGNGEIAEMKSCVVGKGYIHYEFSGDIHLNLFHRDGETLYHLRTPRHDVTRAIDPIVLKHFKTIGMRDASTEIDRIKDVFSSSTTERELSAKATELK